jgi:hypothetical protein
VGGKRVHVKSPRSVDVTVEGGKCIFNFPSAQGAASADELSIAITRAGLEYVSIS